MDLFSYLLGKKSGGGGGITPTGTINISENGTYDVTNYASAEVNIKKGLVLPDGYTTVEYIESSGTEYIDTGYKINANTKIEVKCSQLRSAGGSILGAREGDILYSTANYGGKVAFYYNELTRLVTDVSTGEYVFEDVSMDASSFKVNNELYDNLSINQYPNYDFYLFSINRDGEAADFSKSKIGRVKISENNVLLHDLIPCYRNSDSVVGMYDLVGETFLTNSGTGSFTYPPNYL